jgi:N utilization substance protein A
VAVTLTDEARRYVAVLAEETDVTATDCLVDDEYGRVVYVVPPGTMGQVIGPGGEYVERLEETVSRDVEVVEGADTPGAFVANALAPAAVYNVTISGEDDEETVAYAEVDRADRGVAIGADGRNIELARRLAKRHFDVDGIELT